MGSAGAGNDLAPARMLGDPLRRGGRCFQPGADGIPGHRPAEQITLAFVATLRRHQLQLLFRLDAFGDHDFVEAGAEAGDGADDGAGVALVAEIADERLVDLDLIEGELAQVVERGVAGAEVVERQADAEILELLHRRQGAVVVLEQQTLGYLQLDPLRRQPRLRQRRYHLQSETAVPELDRRQIDGNLDAMRPGRRLDAGAVQGPFADRDDQAGLFGDGDEHRRRHFSAYRMGPAQQRLAGRYTAAAQIDQRLVIQLELLRGKVQHDELVAAEARDHVSGADDGTEPERDLLEELVADRVTERVIDGFKPVEVDQVDRDVILAFVHGREHGVDPLAELRPVGEAREFVELGEMRDALLRALAFGHVFKDDDGAAVGLHSARHGDGAVAVRRGLKLVELVLPKAAGQLANDLLHALGFVIAGADAVPDQLR